VRPIKKAGLAPAISKLSRPFTRRPGGARLHPGKEHAGYFFFAAFLAFFFVAFFAFFAFLAIVSSQGLMVERDTRDARRRASLATSSVTNSADSRAPAPRCHICVIALSTAQMRFPVISTRESASQHAATPPHMDAGDMPNDPTIVARRSRIQNQRRAFADRSEVPLSATRALSSARTRGRVMDERLPETGGGTLRVLRAPC
jgi:hypothetical protein